MTHYMVGGSGPKTLITTPSQLSIYIKLARSTRRSAQTRKEAFEVTLFLDEEMIVDIENMAKYLECNSEELVSALIFRTFLDIGNVIDLVHGSSRSTEFHVPNVDDVFTLLNYARYTKVRMPNGTGKYATRLYIFESMLPLITRFCEELECSINELVTALVYKNYLSEREMEKLQERWVKHIL